MDCTEASKRLRLLKTSKSFGGLNKRYEYDSESCGCPLKFTIYFPPSAAKAPVPVLYYLASLTTDDETFVDQAGAQRRASELGVALVCSDNSPRDVPHVEEQGEWPSGFTFGYASSWYLDATVEKYRNWQMRKWIAVELPLVLQQHFRELDTKVASIMGFSMGGHGALIIGLGNSPNYKSISALAPVCTPSSSFVGEKFFSVGLGPDREGWKAYDASEMVKRYAGPHKTILIDTGSLDRWPVVDPHNFAKAAEGNPDVTVINRIQEGYTHDFHFVATFIDEHLDWHFQHLKAYLHLQNGKTEAACMKSH